MNCPKCNHEQPDDACTCERCGVIFAKLHKTTYRADYLCKPKVRGRLTGLLLGEQAEPNSVMLAGRFVLWLGL